MKWQPIETAPKDGTQVDLWTGVGRTVDCQFVDGQWRSWDYDEYESYGFNAIRSPVTHWMPSPEAPNVELTGRAKTPETIHNTLAALRVERRVRYQTLNETTKGEHHGMDNTNE